MPGFWNGSSEAQGSTPTDQTGPRCRVIDHPAAAADLAVEYAVGTGFHCAVLFLLSLEAPAHSAGHIYIVRASSILADCFLDER